MQKNFFLALVISFGIHSVLTAEMADPGSLPITLTNTSPPAPDPTIIPVIYEDTMQAPSNGDMAAAQRLVADMNHSAQQNMEAAAELGKSNPSYFQYLACVGFLNACNALCLTDLNQDTVKACITKCGVEFQACMK